MSEIKEGLKSGVDVSQYADPKFDWSQMWQIREGLKSGVDVSWYADPKFDYEQMKQIRLMLEDEADPELDEIEMQEIKEMGVPSATKSIGSVKDQFTEHYSVASPGYYGYGGYGSDYSIDFWVLKDRRCVATSEYSGTEEFKDKNEMFKEVYAIQDEMIEEVNEMYKDRELTDAEYDELMSYYEH